MQLDPVLLEILANKVVAASEEMASTLQRTARTLFVKEAADFACALVGVDGRVFAHPWASGVNLFVNLDANEAIRAVPDLEPGDVIVTNDPYLSGAMVTHTPDITVIEPYFHKGRIVAYGWCFIHSTDVGGSVPSSIAPSLDDIFQEGIRFPPMKLMKKGEMNEDFVTLLRANCRIPDENMGDIRAMLASLRTGRLRTADIIERHGVATFVTCQEDLQAYSAAKALAVLKRVPNGTYEFWDFMDDDLVTRIPIRLRVKMTVADGTVHLDFSGTDPEVKAAYNIATFDRFHEWLTMRFTSFLCTNDKTIVINAGLYRPFTMTNPRGSVLNAEFPAAVGLRSAPARRLNDAITGAILKAAPEMMAAPTPGAGMTFVLAEYDAAGAKPTVGVLQPMRGGMGGFQGRDGVDCRDATMSNMSNHSIEFVEADSGVLFLEYDIRPDSGGPGRWRGGVGQMLTVKILRDGSVVIPRGMERLRFPPYGAVGGKPAQPYRCLLNKGRADEKPLPKLDSLPIKKGDTVTMMMPGAGGYGDPYLRDPELVRRDVEWGFVGRSSAKRDYGVAITAKGAIDADATRRLRAVRVKDNVRAGFDFGPEREAWEAVFDDATMGEINRRLMALPRSSRWETRRRLFTRAVPDMPLAGDKPFLVQVLADPDAIRARLFRVMDEILPRAVDRAAD